MASEMTAMPPFSLESDTGDIISDQSLSGSAYVLFFYPRDNTSGCTKEAIGFTEAMPDFEAAGARVIGISADDLKSHAKFREKQNLTMPLLYDEDAKLAKTLGVWVEKSMYGKTFFGIERSTFLVRADGTIAKTWRKVKVPGHVDDVLSAARAL